MDKSEADKKKSKIIAMSVVGLMVLYVLFLEEEPVEPKRVKKTEVTIDQPQERLRLYPDGTLSRREFVKDGKLIGRQEYFANKKLIKSEYHDGSLANPVIIHYDENEKPKSVENCPPTPFNDEQKMLCVTEAPPLPE